MSSEIQAKTILGIVASFIALAGFYPYFRGILRKKTVPHIYTWLIWTITQGTAVAGLWYGGGGWGALELSIGFLLVLSVFLLSLRYGTRNISRSDSFFLGCSLIAIVGWWEMHNALLAVFMVSVIDLLGYFPSFRKTYNDPWTETPVSWAAFSMANLVGISALNEYNLLTLTYLVTITAANIFLLAICILRRRVLSGIEER